MKFSHEQFMKYAVRSQCHSIWLSLSYYEATNSKMLCLFSLFFSNRRLERTNHKTDIIKTDSSLVFPSLLLKTRRGRFGGTISCVGCWVLWVWSASWWHMSTTVWMWSWPISSPPACSGGTILWPTYRSGNRVEHLVADIWSVCVYDGKWESRAKDSQLCTVYE